MDLLDSILSGMQKPPEVKKPVIKDKEKREKFEKLQRQRNEAAKKQKDILDKFRLDISNKIKDFVNKPHETSTKLKLEPMSKIYRSIVHETCDEHTDEIVCHSFGTEDIDRHCIIWKRGYEPCEDEIRAMKLGVEYKQQQSESDDDDDAERTAQLGKSSDQQKDKFWSKYEKIIGENASGVDAARVALPAKQYGYVPIENKKDQRSIEQIMNERKSKRQKTTSAEQPASSSRTTDNQ